MWVVGLLKLKDPTTGIHPQDEIWSWGPFPLPENPWEKSNGSPVRTVCVTIKIFAVGCFSGETTSTCRWPGIGASRERSGASIAYRPFHRSQPFFSKAEGDLW